MKNSNVFSARRCKRTLSVASVVCVLLFAGCASVDGTAENHKVTASLVAGHVEQGQEEPENQAVGRDPGYEWFY